MNTPTISAPKNVPRIEPRPPKRLMPPITTAVMDSRFASKNEVGLTEPTRPIEAHAAIAQMKPPSM